MTRLIHLSDLHFGRDRPELLNPLVETINEAKPDLVVVSGDLTQRARRHQFAAARQFLDRLDAPWLTVPGNHDVPIHRPLTRMFRPFRAYREAIARDLTPTRRLEGVTVIGLNTVDSRRWQRGRVRSSAIRKVCELCRSGDADTLNVLVAHHPFEHKPGVRKVPMRGAREALDKLSDCGGHIILSGHLHVWLAEPFLTRPFGARMLQVHAGTGLSTRQRGEANDFAVIDRDGPALAIARWAADADDARFHEVSVQHFRFNEEGWRTTKGPRLPREATPRDRDDPSDMSHDPGPGDAARADDLSADTRSDLPARPGPANRAPADHAATGRGASQNAPGGSAG